MPSFTNLRSLEQRAITLYELCEQNEGKRITVGAAIMSQPSLDLLAKTLLLQRAANEDVLPNMYELPGGNWEESDSMILDTVAREVKEETGLDMSAVLSEFEEFEYVTKRGPAKQLNFLIQVDQSAIDSGTSAGDPIPNLSPSEHQAYLWIGSPRTLEGLQMSDGIKTVVTNAFRALAK